MPMKNGRNGSPRGNGGHSLLVSIKALVARECANHQSLGPWGTNNYCWMREKSNGGVCVFFSDLEEPRCRYFEEAVLPLDKELKGLFSSETLALQIRQGRKRRAWKTCERPGCEKSFLARSNAQRFCPACQRGAYREKSREWDREKRIAQNRAETALEAFQ
jgi:hypothetical protein